MKGEGGEDGVVVRSPRPSFSLSLPPQEELGEAEDLMQDMMETGVPAPPDGGYGWVIVFASFVCNLVLDGITCTFGVFLPQMAESFQAGKGSVAWAGSLLCGGSLCIGTSPELIHSAGPNIRNFKCKVSES